ncbi:hypothetical protein [Adlercreutzia caecimuris]|jgi:hypothetical protein|uniref:hypothetical protein n=1 Tax=Adlercreutzia caecimuris TaxID=671266 RepID=UPI00272B9FF0|nr:hypothetical protein [Adlercreutzia caecimuris]
MLHAFDEAMPENLRLGAHLDAIETPASEERLGDKIWMDECEQGYRLFEVIGFGDGGNGRPELKGVPYVKRYDHDGDYSWNGNGYLHSETCRIQSRE